MDRPLHICLKPGCNTLTREKYCDAHRIQRTKAAVRQSERRPNSYARGYNGRWRKESKEYLASHPWCAECERYGRREPATEVDHKQPHKGDMVLFWDQKNWQGLCHRCHSRKTAREDGGFGNVRKSAEEGYPPTLKSSI